MTKPCKRCFRDLSLDEFYAQPRTSTGLMSICKACHKLAIRLRYRRTIAAHAEYERKRERQPDRKAKKATYVAAYRARNPDKYKARTAVNNALRDGRLVKRPCAGCGSSDVQAHHHDYSKPLDIRWLCFVCHREGEHGQRVAA